MPRSRASRAGAAPLSAVEAGLRYLARRRRFEKDVRSHLRGRGVQGEELERAIRRLEELGVLSDAETCRAWIRDRLRFSPRSRSALRVQLLRKGAGEEAVESALDDVLPPGGDVELAVNALGRSASRLRSLPDPVSRRRMWARLAGRGFAPDVAREAIARVLGREEAPE